jgi:hypothetical protein
MAGRGSERKEVEEIWAHDVRMPEVAGALVPVPFPWRRTAAVNDVGDESAKQ